MKNISLTYDGEYPNLCSGELIITIDGTDWIGFRLSSGGSVWFDENWSEHVESGEWSIYEWPSEFPEEYKDEVLYKVNYEIPQGCCGGCV